MEDMIYNSYEEDVEVYGDFELPIPTFEIKEKNRKIDFSVIVALMLRSNSNVKEYSRARYIDYSRINKNEICKECGISRKTLDRRLKYLEEKEVLRMKNTNKGLVYIINYSTDNKYFITVHHKILKNLLRYTNKDAIKVYLALKIQCDLLENKNPMTNAYLCNLLGYPANNHRNLSNMGAWTNTLANNGFIEKIQKREYEQDEQGKKKIIRTDTYYKINALEEWQVRKTKGIVNIEEEV